MLRRRTLVAWILLIVAVVVFFIANRRLATVPRIEEEVRVHENGIARYLRFQYQYRGRYPVSIQIVNLARFNTNVVAVSNWSSKEFTFVLKNRELIVRFPRIISPGDMVRLVVQTRVVQNPLLNLVHRGKGRYCLHYVSREYLPGLKKKEWILPENAEITRIVSSYKDMKQERNRVALEMLASGNQLFDVTVSFRLQFRLEFAHNPLPPILQGRQVIFRASGKLYPKAPHVVLHKGATRFLKMKRKGDLFIATHEAGEHVLRYQYWFDHLAFADNSLWQRRINSKGQSESVFTTGQDEGLFKR